MQGREDPAALPEMQFTILSRNYFAMLAGQDDHPKSVLRRSGSDDRRSGSKYPNLPLLHDHLRTPSLRVLASYCHHESWMWPLEPSMQQTASERMLQARLQMQLSPISAATVEQNDRALSYAELFTDCQPGGSGAASSVVQSVVSRSQFGQVSSELWVEPQHGEYSFMENGEEQVLMLCHQPILSVAYCAACNLCANLCDAGSQYSATIRMDQSTNL